MTEQHGLKQPYANIETERDRLKALNAELVKAIEHALGHDDALKPEYQLPASLSWELRETIKRAKAKEA